MKSVFLHMSFVRSACYPNRTFRCPPLSSILTFAFPNNILDVIWCNHGYFMTSLCSSLINPWTYGSEKHCSTKDCHVLYIETFSTIISPQLTHPSENICWLFEKCTSFWFVSPCGGQPWSFPHCNNYGSVYNSFLWATFLHGFQLVTENVLVMTNCTT